MSTLMSLRFVVSHFPFGWRCIRVGAGGVMLHSQGRAILPYLTHYLPRYLLMQAGQAMFLRSGGGIPESFRRGF